MLKSNNSGVNSFIVVNIAVVAGAGIGLFLPRLVLNELNTITIGQE